MSGRILPFDWLGPTRSVIRRSEQLQSLSDVQLLGHVPDLRWQLLARQQRRVVKREIYAASVEAIRREVGLQLRPVQIAGAFGHSQRTVIEIQTGEGKTLTGVPAAAYLIIATEMESRSEKTSLYEWTNRTAQSLAIGKDFTLDPARLAAHLTEHGARTIILARKPIAMDAVSMDEIFEQTERSLVAHRLSQHLKTKRIPHSLLNANQDADEALVVARAGSTGIITIATNMAGRGTDIKLSPDVLQSGGLHVIVTEVHASRRIDRQLVGRAARQGEPGSFPYILSYDDEIWFQCPSLKPSSRMLRLGLRFAIRRFFLAQRRLERAAEKQRAKMFKSALQFRRSLRDSGINLYLEVSD